MVCFEEMAETKTTSAGALRRQLHSENGFIAVPTTDPEGVNNAVQLGATVFIDCENDVVPLQRVPNLAERAQNLGGLVIIRTQTAQPSSIADYIGFHPDGLVIPSVESGEACIDLYQAMVNSTESTTQPALIVQIESVAGVERTREIATSPGVDAILIGPNDLAASMGLAGQPEHPAVVDAVNQVTEQLGELKIPFGLPVTFETIENWRQRGARLFFMLPRHFNRSK